MVTQTIDDQTSMAVKKSTLDALDKIKVHPREPYEDVVLRLLKEHKEASS